MRHHPAPYEHIVVSKDVYDKLNRASVATIFEKETWEIAAEAVDEWMCRHEPNALQSPATSGYQWKSVFLPHGTLLRTIFGGKNHHCLVEGDQILYQGAAVSPSGFVNAVGGIRRNAWRCTWILFPNTLEWKLADTMRPDASERHAHKPIRQSRPRPAPVREPRVPGPDMAVTATPPQSRPVTERRSTVPSPFADLIRHELIPFLSRLCAMGAIPPGAPPPNTA